MTLTKTTQAGERTQYNEILNLGGNARVLQFLGENRCLALAGLVRMEITFCRDKFNRICALGVSKEGR